MIGRPIKLNGSAFTIVGVARSGSPALWLEIARMLSPDHDVA